MSFLWSLFLSHHQTLLLYFGMYPASDQFSSPALLAPYSVRWYLVAVLICIDERCWASFHMPVSHLYTIFGKISVQVFWPFFKLFCFFWYLVVWLVYYFRYNPLVGHIICKYFTLFSRLSFCFVDGFLCVKPVKFT